METRTIRKEDIQTQTFKGEQVLENTEAIMNDLTTACRLGNEYHTKVVIDFICDNGPMQVETTVWAVGEKYICLKAGAFIPINKITKVAF
jgi:hypothetical protein